MCGIAGIYDLKGDRSIPRAVLKRMADTMEHRGPDGEGFFTAPGIGLAHRRLAIIDIEGGVQPFECANDQGVLTFNGEIYNYEELAKDLASHGISLKTRSDTEVLAEGFAKQGADYIHSLRGMFAFAFWRASDKSLTIARDRLGEKPLYYALSPKGFLVFASDVAAIIASGLIETDLNHQAFADYCLYGYVPDPKSIYRNIQKLRPANILHLKKGDTYPSPKNYWRPVFAARETLSVDDAISELEGRFDEAVQSQLVADVPLGAFLSGGIDSGGVVSSMARQTQDIATTTIGFDTEKHDERDYARLVANQFNTTHTERLVSLEAADLIDPVAQAYGEPFADSSALPTYVVSKIAREKVTVAISGDGGDELFAGYRRYQFYLGEEKLRALLPYFIRRSLFGPAGALYPKLDFAPRPLRLKTTLQSLGESRAVAYARTVAASLPDRAAALMSNDLKDSLDGYDPRSVIENASNKVTTNDPLSIAQHIDLRTWLAGRMLVKVDRSSMAHSLEVRPPLLDHRLVEWAGGIPSNYKLKDGRGKYILREMLKKRLPEKVIEGKKRGFELPLAAWMRAADGPVNRLADSSAWKQSGLFDQKAVEKMIASHRKGTSDFSQELWTVIMADAFMNGRPEKPSRRSQPSATMSAS